MAKSPSLQRAHGAHAFRHMDTGYNSQESPKVHSPPSEHMVENGLPLVSVERAPSIRRQDSFEMRLPELPKIDIHTINRQSSNASDPESPISPLLTSDPTNERSHSKTFSRPLSHFNDIASRQREAKDLHQRPPSFWRLAELSFAEWLYALLGSTGAAIFGSFNPLLAYTIALIVATYYQHNFRDIRHDVNRWCLIIAGMGIITVVANFLQHFYFGIMGEKMTERIRRMMFSGN